MHDLLCIEVVTDFILLFVKADSNCIFCLTLPIHWILEQQH